MRIALHGTGRMGRALERIASERQHQVVGRFDRSRPIEPELLREADVLIDFSHRDAVRSVVDAACAARIDLVIGTTGWNEQADAVRERCEAAGIGAVHAANFSPGANALFVIARTAAHLVAGFDGYGCGIEERHHAGKKDAPSGTALRIASEVEAGSAGRIVPAVASLRVGAEVGLHTLLFDSADDLIEITHRARNRDGFARGALLAAEAIHGKRGFFRFDELLGFGVKA
ncbi:MAG TPA: dihydrodipicolinate reductase C-terminal domain-containing protein [Thermoanaerobaculia bacterium]|nr:dihydrodipicolinate reductase C-terminal domain-containing protein [Thermoanaerobaculia bacterium]